MLDAPLLHAESPRLLVRPVTPADLPDLMAVNGDAEVVRHLPYAVWAGPADGEAWLERMQTLEAVDQARQLVLVERDGGAVVGTLLLFRFEPASQRAEVGYALARRCWGQGLMREALVAVCARLFDAGAVRRFEAEVNPENAASRGLLLSLGFVHEGRRRQRWVAKGAVYDVDCFGLLSGELRGI
ncbi:MAG: GNAT family N-acetyltransferase [Piscinibacter sp.]